MLAHRTTPRDRVTRRAQGRHVETVSAAADDHRLLTQTQRPATSSRRTSRGCPHSSRGSPVGRTNLLCRFGLGLPVSRTHGVPRQCCPARAPGAAAYYLLPLDRLSGVSLAVSLAVGLAALTGIAAQLVGFQNVAVSPDQRLHAAASYSLRRPPRIGRRRILPWTGSGTGDAGRGGRNCSARCGRRAL